MNKSLWISSSGMEAQQAMTDTIANNMANVNTTAYKRSVAQFKDMLYQSIQSPGAETSDSERPVGVEMGTGVRLGSIAKNFNQGGLKNTSSASDLAIEGEGFFEIELPGGQSGYTRDGNFHRNSSGELVTTSGYKVVGMPNLGSDVNGVTITKDGVVTVDSKGVMKSVGTIQLSRFNNPEGLKSLGNNLYVETKSSGSATTGNPGQNGMGAVAQYFLESSNVEIVREMVDMIASQRAYELNSKSIKTADEMMRMISNLK